MLHGTLKLGKNIIISDNPKKKVENLCFCSIDSGSVKKAGKGPHGVFVFISILKHNLKSF